MPKSHSAYQAAAFTEAVLSVVKSIPVGETRSYAAVAETAGYPGYARQVARLMSHNYRPEVPCHRVIRSDGGLGGYNRGGTLNKRALLLNEGYNC